MGTTIREIARQTGVSASTVSRVLSQKGRISARTRSQVLSVARSLGYSPPQEDARVVESAEGGSIGILFNRRISSLVTDPFYGAVVAGVEESLQRLGYRAFLRSIDGTQENGDLFDQWVAGDGHGGLLLVGCDIHPDVARRARDRGIPVILVDNEIPDTGADCVVSDNEAAARSVVEYLYRMGHRRVGFVGGPQSHISLAHRYSGYANALADLGAPPPRRWAVFAESVEKHGPEIGYEGAQRLMDLPQPPTAIFADNDMTALGVLKALHERDVDVPGEVSVVGFDDIQVAAHTHPPLTTVHIPKQQMGSIAARRLVEIIQGIDPVSVKIVLRATLVVRGSVADITGRDDVTGKKEASS